MTLIEGKALGVEIDIKAISAEGEFEGYASTFGNADCVGDVILPGAFKKSIRGGSMPPMLWQHDMRQPIGVWTSMKEDATGLLAKGRFITSTATGGDAYQFVKAGAVKGLSIGFRSDDWEFNKNKPGRTIKTVDLMEVSVVTLPANPKAQIFDVKTVGGEVIPAVTVRIVEKALRDAGRYTKSERLKIVSDLKHLLRDAEDEPADEAPRDEEGLADLLRALKERAALSLT